MPRKTAVALVALLCAAAAQFSPFAQPSSFAQEAAPAAQAQPAAQTQPASPQAARYHKGMPVGDFPYGPGSYLAWWKMIPPILLVWLWVKSVDWQNQDGQRLNLRKHRVYNLVSLASFLTVMLAFWAVPLKFGVFVFVPLLFVAYVVPFTIYVKARNLEVMTDDKVFTRKHLRKWFSEKLAPLGIKIAAELEADVGVPVELAGRGAADERQDNLNLLSAKRSPYFDRARETMFGLFERNSTAMLLDYSQQAVAVQHQIDGIWYKADNLDREMGDGMLEVLKLISSLNPKERRARQRGVFGAKYKETKFDCRLTSQGTQTGERVLIQLVDENLKKKRLPDLGMRDKMQQELKAILDQKIGFVLCSAPRGGGLTSLLTAVTGTMDRYLRGFICIEDAQNHEFEVENVPVKTFDSARQESPATVLLEVLREYPDALVAPDMVDAKSATTFLEEGRTEKFVVAGIRAKEASEALVRVVSDLKVPVDRVAASVTAVVNVRLVRRLCETCREAYAPAPAELQRLRLPPDRVQALYRARQPSPDQKEICSACQGLGFKGRIGVFELLVVGDEVREALAKGLDVGKVREAARRSGMRLLQEEGLRHVVAGVTSVEELIRALKE